MSNLFVILLLISFLAFIFYGIKTVISAIKSDKVNSKKMMKFASIAFGILIISFIGLAITSEPIEETKEVTAVNKEETANEKAARELKEEQAKAAKELKEEEEKAAAEAKAKEQAKNEAIAAAEELARIEEERKAKEAALKLNGSGDGVSNKFQLEEGFVIIHSTHSGSRNFISELFDSAGNRVELVTNTIGSYNGKQIYTIQNPGEYMFNVQADGAWTIGMSQYVPEDLEKDSFEGKGDDVRFVEIEQGARTFELTHNGKRNFIVQVNNQVLLVNDIGAYEGSQLQKVEDTSVYYFNIQADGNWTININ